MLVKDNANIEQGTIVGADGVPLNRPTVMLTRHEARMLREYKKFLQKYALKEALYCQTCWSGNREDGTEAFVRDDKIGIICRCTTRLYMGHTF